MNQKRKENGKIVQVVLLTCPSFGKVTFSPCTACLFNTGPRRPSPLPTSCSRKQCNGSEACGDLIEVADGSRNLRKDANKRRTKYIEIDLCPEIIRLKFIGIMGLRIALDGFHGSAFQSIWNHCSHLLQSEDTPTTSSKTPLHKKKKKNHSNPML